VSTEIHDVHWKNFENLVVEPSLEAYPPPSLGSDSFAALGRRDAPLSDPRSPIHRYENRIFYKVGEHAALSLASFSTVVGSMPIRMRVSEHHSFISVLKFEEEILLSREMLGGSGESRGRGGPW